jgi:hypothetical protein
MPLLDNRGAMQTTISPEERMLKNERKRVQSYINDYERNPKKWNKGMTETLERLALQYQIPFKRAVPTAGVGAHIAAGLGGLVDSVAFDLIPDSWYSDESTRTTANASKIVGYVGQVAAAVAATALTGGVAAPTIGAAAANVGKGIQAASGIGKIAAGAKGLGQLGVTVASKGLPGRAVTAGIQGVKKGIAPYAAGQGYKWAGSYMDDAAIAAQKGIVKNVERTVNSGGINIVPIVKDANLNKQSIDAIKAIVKAKHGNSRVGAELIRQATSAKAGASQIAGVSTSQLQKIANSAGIQGGGKLGPKVTRANIVKAAENAKIKLSDKQIDAITDNLLQNNITRMKDAIPHFTTMGGSPGAMLPLEARSVANFDSAMGLGGLGLVGGKAFDLKTPSREELEAQQDPYDPYYGGIGSDPYNV